MTEVVEAKQQPLFRKPHELTKFVAQLRKLSKKALETLEMALSSEDERVRIIAAKELLKFYADAAAETNADDLKRLLLEVKAQGLIGAGSTAQEDDNTPMLDFNNINPEFADAAVIDLGTVNKI